MMYANTCSSCLLSRTNICRLTLRTHTVSVPSGRTHPTPSCCQQTGQRTWDRPWKQWSPALFQAPPPAPPRFAGRAPSCWRTLPAAGPEGEGHAWRLYSTYMHATAMVSLGSVEHLKPGLACSPWISLLWSGVCWIAMISIHHHSTVTVLEGMLLTCRNPIKGSHKPACTQTHW